MFWEQFLDANQNLDNSTCGEAAFFSVECEEKSAEEQKIPVEGVYFMESINDYRMAKVL